MIYEGDIVVLKSEVLLDTDDGGGALTSDEVVDGVSNNLFPDISELDRVYGRIALRKAFPAVLTENVDSYYGAHAIVSRPPADPKVSACLFSTRDWFDRRVSAKDSVERYLARGPKWAGHVLEMQLEGQRAIQQCVRVQDAEPKVGQGLTLTYHEGLVSEKEQYVRVTKVSAEIRLFTVSGKDLERKVLTIEISDPLRYDFQGPTVLEFELGSNLDNRANLRDTRVANAATYFGVSPLTVDADLGDAAIDVESIFTQLVPSSQAETALIDLYGSGLNSMLVAGNTGTIVYTLASYALAPNAKLYLGSPVTPGSLSLVIGGNTFTDVGGVLKLSAVSVGTIEYDKGLLSFGNTDVPTVTNTAVATFKPAALPTRASESASIHIVQGNRGYNYTMTVSPIPAPGSTIVSYMAQGKVYYLYDTGQGILRGSDSAFGSGSVNFSTGTILVTLGVLPDADSDLLIHWGVPVSTFVRSGITVPAPKHFMQLAHQQVTPGSVTIDWVVGVTAKTATDNGLGGFTGDATGKINYSSGEIVITTAVLVAGGTEFEVDYQYGPPNEQVFVAPVRGVGGYITVTLPNVGGAIIPGTVELEFNVDVLSGSELYNAMSTLKLVPPPANYQRSANVKFFDKELAPGDPVGVWIFPNGVNQVVYPGNIEAQVGTMTYATREVSFLPEIIVPTPIPAATFAVYAAGTPGQDWAQLNAGYKPTSYVNVNLAGIMPVSGNLRVRWRTDSADTSATETFEADGLRYDLTPGFGEDIVSGSVRFKLGTRTYIDRAGSLYHSVNPVTGSGTYAGTVGYQTGIVTLSDWPSGVSNVLTLESLVTEVNVSVSSGAVFRVPIVPVRPGSIQIRAIAADGPGTEFTETLDNTGNVSTANVRGVADYNSGVVTLRFGQELEITGGNRATVEAQPWYDAAQEYVRLGLTYIFEPKPVYTDSLRYNAVGYTYLPLSADILGLDPIRLPSDGRVPIFNLGNVVVIHNTEKPEFVTPTIGETLDVGRERVSYIRLVDSLGAKLPDNMYTFDLAAGTVTLSALFSMAGYTGPLYAENRIEDMALCIDVQINGRLSLSKTLSHDYPADDTLVSSALIIGDLQARAFGVFSQQTWTNVWSDTRIGDEIIPQYNDTVYPIEVSNVGSLEESWAIIFTSNTAFRVVGRGVGQIGTGNTSSDFEVENPAFPGASYFKINGAGGEWGDGWAAGNVLRFNTAGANYPLWLARTVLQGDATVLDDSFQVQIRGDVDNP